MPFYEELIDAALKRRTTRNFPSKDFFSRLSGLRTTPQSAGHGVRCGVHWFGQHELVIHPQQNRCEQAYGRDDPPHHPRLVLHFAEVVDQKAAELPADE